MKTIAEIIANVDITTSSHLKAFRALKKNEASLDFAVKKQKRIAILSSTSSQLFTQVFYVQLVQNGYQPLFYEGTFGNIIGEILDETSGLYQFAPEYVIIFDDYTSLNTELPAFATQMDIDRLIQSNSKNYQNLWQHLTEKLDCEIFQSNFVLPLTRVYDQLEMEFAFSQANIIEAVNTQLIQTKPKNAHIVDMQFIATQIGLRNWYDEKNYYLSKMGVNYECLPEITLQFVNKINAINGKIKKVIVLDLDNTLWGGVIGDDGIDGIKLGSNSPEGEAFVAFQSYLLQLKNRGILLAVCSKNEMVAAQIPFTEHPEMILQLDDIACFKANWQDKATNIKEIALELNLGTDSFVFVDDNPAERLIVKEYLPEVTVIELSTDPALYIRDIATAQCFDWSQLTKEDVLRNASYITEVKRKQLANSFVDYDEYLTSLEMTGCCAVVEDTQVERYAQLTQKSNQFNLRTVRYSESEVNILRQREDYLLLGVTLADRFSQYGLIGCIALRRQSATSYFVENWLMSCRVLKRQVEHFTLNMIVLLLKARGVEKLIGEYIPTEKNKLVFDFYQKLGFTATANNYYELNLNEYIETKTKIKMKEQ